MFNRFRRDISSDQSGSRPRNVAAPDNSVSDRYSPKERRAYARNGGKSLFENVFEPLVTLRNSPRYDAVSVATGLAVGFGIPVGGQLLILALLRIVMRFNYLVAAGFTFVSNPFNMIPLYYGYYCLGSYVLGRPITLHFDRFEKLLTPVIDKDFFWEAFLAFAELGSDILVRWVVAAVILAAVFGFLGYIITFYVQKKRCRAAAARLGIRYEEFLHQLLKKKKSSGAGRPSGVSSST